LGENTDKLIQQSVAAIILDVPHILPNGENINKTWTKNTRQKDVHRKFYR